MAFFADSFLLLYYSTTARRSLPRSRPHPSKARSTKATQSSWRTPPRSRSTFLAQLDLPRHSFKSCRFTRTPARTTSGNSCSAPGASGPHPSSGSPSSATDLSCHSSWYSVLSTRPRSRSLPTSSLLGKWASPRPDLSSVRLAIPWTRHAHPRSQSPECSS